MKRTAAVLSLATAVTFLTGCVPEVDKYFLDKRLNRLSVLRDDLQPGTLVIHSNGIAKSTDHILDVVPAAELPIRGFEAVLPSATQGRSVEASVALKVVDAVLPIGLDGTIKLANSVKISQTRAAGQRVTETQLSTLLKAPQGAALRQWVLDRAKRKISTYVVMETYRAKDFTLTADSGKDVTTELAVGAVKIFDKAGAKMKISRHAKEELSISGDKFYVFAVSVAAFDIVGPGAMPTLGPLGVDLSRPVPRVPVLGDKPAAPGATFMPVGLPEEF